jgi:iron-sulfur cluster repair protein YtfE (RIC family)
MARAQNSGDRNAIDMLTDEHRHVQKLFKDFEKTDRADTETLRELVETTCMELQIHSMLEEELFYPALRGEVAGDETDERLNRAEVEHEVADELIAKLRELSSEDPMYCAYFAVLGEYVKHHMRDEEKELFPRAANATGLDLQQLGEDMRQRRDELYAEIESGEAEEDSEEDSGEDSEEDPEDDVEDDAIGPDDMSESTDEDEELEDEQEARDRRRTRH